MEETPNLRLVEVDAGRRNWSAVMNQNLVLIDAAISTYFSIYNLQGIWKNSTAYLAGQTVVDNESSAVYACLVDHTSASVPTLFSQDRLAHPSYWGVYSSPARSRGTWMPNTLYSLNDFVVSGLQYAICVETHTSSDTFALDVASGKWSVLVDLSAVGTSVLPVPSGADANKFTVVDSLGVGYTIVAAAQALNLLGGTSIGKDLFTAISMEAARAAIGASPDGDYQPLSAALTAMSNFSIGSFADNLLAGNTAQAVLDALGVKSIAQVVAASGINTFLANPTSANLRAAITDETGTGSAVFSAAPTLTGHVTVPTPTSDLDAANRVYVQTYVEDNSMLRAYSLCAVVSGTVTTLDSLGLTITRDGNGRYTGTLDPPFPDTNYRVHITTASTLNGAAGQGEWGTLDTASGGRVSSSVFKFMTRGDNIDVQDANELHVDVFWG